MAEWQRCHDEHSCIFSAYLACKNCYLLLLLGWLYSEPYEEPQTPKFYLSPTSHISLNFYFSSKRLFLCFLPGATGWFADNHSFVFRPKASRFNLVFTSFSSSGSYVLSSGFSFPEMSREQYVGRGNESLVSLSVNNSNLNTSLFRFFSRRCCPLSPGDFCSYKGLPSSSSF